MLEIQSLTKRFGEVEALSEVSLTVREGEFFSLLGPSGCGKTTLLRILGGFESLTEGRILFGGQRIDGLPPHRRQINTVFQRYALFPHLTVRQNIAFGLEMKKVPRAEALARVDEALALVRLESFGDRTVPTLSGGQMQRVALARALVNRPQILLLDEPLSALDLKLREQMQVELLALQRRLGHTFILVTHDQEEALTLSDRIAVMSGGRIEQVGTPEEIYKRPSTDFAARFIGSVNVAVGQSETEAAAGATFRLRLADGSILEARALQPVSQGARLRVLLRPEKIRLGSDIGSGEGWNRFAGVVVESLYQGPVTRVVVRVPQLSERHWTVTVGSTELEAGGPVELGFQARDCVVMSEDGQSLV